MFDWLQRPDGPPRWFPVAALLIAAGLALAIGSGSVLAIVVVAGVAVFALAALVWRSRTHKGEPSSRSVD